MTARGGSDFHELMRAVLDRWVAEFARVCESMTGASAKTSWQPAPPPPAQTPPDEGAILWWEQELRGAAATLWVGTPEKAWRHCAALTLQSAGLDAAAADEARSTWLEILGQATSALARSAGTALGREVVCGSGAERRPSLEARDWLSVTLECAGESLPPLTVGFSAGLGEAIASAASLPQPEPPAPPRPAGANRDGRPSPAMELLLDLELPVSISFGKTQMALKDVLKLTTGSIVELNRTADDPVEILVNQRLIARGEVVVVDGNYGIRIQELASRQDRLRSIP